MNFNDFYKDKEVLITGGLGFIGSNLAKELVDLNAKVTIIDSLLPEAGGNEFNINEIKDKVNVVVDDIRNEKPLAEVIKNKDIIFNLAGTLAHAGSMKNPLLDHDINSRAQLQLLEVVRKVNPSAKIIFTGTRAQYGRPLTVPVKESHPLNPQDVNGVNNTAAEMFHLLYNRVYNINACVLRLTNTYGPRHQMKNPDQGVINWFIRQALDNQDITLHDGGNQKRDINYVSDVIDALLLVGMKDTAGSVYNIGGDSLSLKEIAEIITNITNTKIKITPCPEETKRVGVGDFIADISKIKELGFEPKVKPEQGLKKTIDFYRENKQHYW